MSQNRPEKTQEACILYRTLEDCRVGGLFRRKGETVWLPKTTTPFSFLEAVEEAHEAKPRQTKKPRGRKARQASQNHITKEDLGIGKPMSSSNVTSADMVTK